MHIPNSGAENFLKKKAEHYTVANNQNIGIIMRNNTAFDRHDVCLPKTVDLWYTNLLARPLMFNLQIVRTLF